MENNNNFFEEKPIHETESNVIPEEEITSQPEEPAREITFDDIPADDTDESIDVEVADEEDAPYEVNDVFEEEMPASPFASNAYTASENIYTPNPKKHKKRIWPTIVITALITSILTSSLCGAAFFIYNNATKEQPTIIFRDGRDMRTKIDLMTALGLDDAENEVPLSVTSVATRVGPTVVGITATGVAQTETLFGSIPQEFASGGTGFIISTDGYIVTNYHVIANSSSVIVTLDNDKEYPARIVGTDERTDLAVLKIEETGLTPAVLGNSSDVQVGELAVAIGNPLGQTLSGTVTAGIISATNRKVTVDGIEYTLLQTDAAINSGNSGGPLANAYGEIIGINNAKIAASGVEGLGFAIPSDIAKPIIEDLIAVGFVRGRPLIGINGRNITEDISTYYNLPIGVYVVSVVEFSAAEKAGLQIGDVITHCEGVQTTTVDELNEIRDQHKAGDTLKLTVVRNGNTLTIPIVLGEDRPSVSLN